jgi:hypothetical protein
MGEVAPSSPAAAFEAHRARLAVALCNELFNCCPESDVSSVVNNATTVGECTSGVTQSLEAELPELDASVLAGRSAFSPAGLEACIDAIPSHDCPAFTALVQSTADAAFLSQLPLSFLSLVQCPGILQSLVPAGGECQEDYEWLVGRCRETVDPAVRRCFTKAGSGELCGINHARCAGLAASAVAGSSVSAEAHLVPNLRRRHIAVRGEPCAPSLGRSRRWPGRWRSSPSPCRWS